MHALEELDHRRCNDSEGKNDDEASRHENGDDGSDDGLGAASASHLLYGTRIPQQPPKPKEYNSLCFQGVTSSDVSDENKPAVRFVSSCVK